MYIYHILRKSQFRNFDPSNVNGNLKLLFLLMILIEDWKKNRYKALGNETPPTILMYYRAIFRGELRSLFLYCSVLLC